MTAACIRWDAKEVKEDAEKGDPPPAAGPAAPVADEKPIGAEEPIRPPAAKAEPLLGKAILVVDQSSDSVYQFDTARGRFRGPAPQVAWYDRTVTLPGYPLPVNESDQPPQGVAVVGNQAVVGGGVEGTAVFLDHSQGELRVAGRMVLPVREVVLEDGRRMSNADAESKRPFIKQFSSFGRDRILVVSYDHVSITSVGYVIDPVSKRVLAAAQLPGGYAASDVQGYGDTAVAAMAANKLVFLSEDLRSTREIPLPGNPTGLVVAGDTAYVSLRTPTTLVKVDLVSGAVSDPLASRPEETIGGPVVVEGPVVWWGHTNLGTITRVDTATGEATEIKACEGVSSMVRYEKALYLSCPGKKTFGVIRDGKPIVAYKVDGFPISVAGPL